MVEIDSVLHCGVLGRLVVGQGHLIVKCDWKVKLSTAPFHFYCSDFKSISEKLCVAIQMYELRFFIIHWIMEHHA
jgi:hypothetical protein